MRAARVCVRVCDVYRIKTENETLHIILPHPVDLFVDDFVSV